MQDASHGLYGQIVRWFQNHSHLDRKACGLVQVGKAKVATSSTSPEESEDDDEAIQLHLRELAKECKKVLDHPKIARLLSLTYHFRCKEMMKKSSPQRIKDMPYSCLSRPLCVS